LLADLYQQKVDIINRGFSGYNSHWGLELLKRFDDEFPFDIDLVTIYFGSNDSVLPNLGAKSIQIVLVNDFKRYLRDITLWFKSKGAKNIVIITPGPVDGIAFAISKGESTNIINRVNENTIKYVDAAIEIAKEFNVPYINLYEVMLKESPDKWGQYLRDGLHLSSTGNMLLFIELVKIINTHFSDLQESNLPFHATHWADVDPATF